MPQISVTKLLDGPRNVVFHLFIQGDGSGDIENEIIVDPGELSGNLPDAPTLTVDRLRYDLKGFSAVLEFDYLVSDTPIWALSDNGAADIDFCDFKGLKDRSAAMDGSGRLKITTFDLGADDVGAIVINLRKD